MAIFIAEHWPILAAVLHALIASCVSAHVVVNKRDPRAALSWVGVIWLVPLLGAVLYWLLGINRIHRRAAALMRERAPYVEPGSVPDCGQADVARVCGAEAEHLGALAHATDRLVRRPLLPGNRLEPLLDGDRAYPAMLEAIEAASRSVLLASYIFDNDQVGNLFAEALGRASARGVEVRVLVDSVGARYSFPTIVRRLRQLKVRTATFLSTWVPFAAPFFNLRNHRKILVVDGAIGFTGGMNIRCGHWLERRPAYPIRDLHFRVTGPLVGQLVACFAEDWAFSTGEQLTGEAWDPRPGCEGDTLARAISDGPDDDFDVLRHVILSAVSSARRSVQVVTPYFVPDQTLLASLGLAALRGVRVEVLIPAVSNIRLAGWACTSMLWQILQHGCRVYLSPPPFDHTKLLIVDEAWVLLGSANWDSRSLRLNFELDVECYDLGLARELSGLVAGRQAAARRIELSDVDGRPLPIRLRDGLAKLFTPYL